MGNELILGPGPGAHIELPNLESPVLIYRSKDGLSVRVPDVRFTIDDRPCTDRATLPLPGVVSCDAFTFAVEPVSGRPSSFASPLLRLHRTLRPGRAGATRE